MNLFIDIERHWITNHKCGHDPEGEADFGHLLRLAERLGRQQVDCGVEIKHAEVGGVGVTLPGHELGSAAAVTGRVVVDEQRTVLVQ